MLCRIIVLNRGGGGGSDSNKLDSLIITNYELICNNLVKIEF